MRNQGLVGGFNETAVAGEIADDGVDLGQTDAHGKGPKLGVKGWTATPSRVLRALLYEPAGRSFVVARKTFPCRL